MQMTTFLPALRGTKKKFISWSRNIVKETQNRMSDPNLCTFLTILDLHAAVRNP
jgi:hypothetical protein